MVAVDGARCPEPLKSVLERLSGYRAAEDFPRVSPARRGSGDTAAMHRVPRAGSVFLAAGGHLAALQSHGIHVTIEAANDESILAAVTSLQAMPS